MAFDFQLIKLTDEINFKLADRLVLFSIMVPNDVAQKQERFRAAGISSTEREGLGSDVALLTSYLLQKSFITTARTLVRAIQLAHRLESLKRHAQRDVLMDMVSEFIADLYGYKVISPQGEILEDTGAEVVNLFGEICLHLMNPSKEFAEDSLAKVLAKKQADYVRLVLEKARRLTSTIQTAGPTGAVNEKLNTLLNRMETANLDWLIETYSMNLSSSIGKTRLPELDNEKQRSIANSVLSRTRERLASFNEATSGTSTRTGLWHSLATLFGWGKDNIDLTETNLLEAEQFVVDLRLYVSYGQQITYLSSVLDKVNEFSAFLTGFETAVTADSRKSLIQAEDKILSERTARNQSLMESSDPVDRALGAIGPAALRPLESEKDLQERLRKQDEELGRSIANLRNIFTSRAESANKILARWTGMGNLAQTMGGMVTQEARQRNAQVTAKLIKEFMDGTKEILEVGGGAAVQLGS
jgi:hypothetical protein